LVFILDKSGLMGDTISGYNSMLEKQQGVDGDCHIIILVLRRWLTEMPRIFFARKTPWLASN